MEIKRYNTQNKSSRNGHIPDLIVCHITDGAYDGTIEWEQNPDSEVSSHFIIARDGRVVQMVDINQCAWTQGLSASLISQATLKVVRDRGVNPNDYCVSIEHEGFYEKTKGALTDAQLASTIEVIKFIISEVKRIYGIDIPVNRQHIVGHCEINPINKEQCPGELFPFERIIAAINKKEGVIGVGASNLLIDVVATKTVTISGWATHPSGINRIDVYIDGEAMPRAEGHINMDRPDVVKAFGKSEMLRCGYTADVQIDGVVLPHQINIAAVANDGSVKWSHVTINKA